VRADLDLVKPAGFFGWAGILEELGVQFGFVRYQGTDIGINNKELPNRILVTHCMGNLAMLHSQILLCSGYS